MLALNIQCNTVITTIVALFIIIIFHTSKSYRLNLNWLAVIFCSLCQCLIVNVEYRLYPEVTMLEPYDDAVTAVEWVKKHKQLIG